MVKLHDFLSKSIVDSEHESHFTAQLKDDSRDDAKNDTEDRREIDLVEKTVQKMGIDWEEKFKIMEKEMKEIKQEWKDMKHQNPTTARFTSPNCVYAAIARMENVDI